LVWSALIIDYKVRYTKFSRCDCYQLAASLQLVINVIMNRIINNSFESAVRSELVTQSRESQTVSNVRLKHLQHTLLHLCKILGFCNTTVFITNVYAIT